MRKFPWHNQSIVTNQCSTCCQNSLFSVRSQWQFSGASMPSIQRPFGFTMADNEHSRGRHPGQQQLLTPQLGLIPLYAGSERKGLRICVVERESLMCRVQERVVGFYTSDKAGQLMSRQACAESSRKVARLTLSLVHAKF